MPSSRDSVNQTFSRIEQMIRAELALYPGRASLIFRIVLACTLVMVLVMVFRMPGAALGAYYPLLLSRTSPRHTARAAFLTGSACTLATMEVLLGAMLFAGSPFLHFVWVAGNLFLVFYLISALKLYDVALAFGLLITNAITIWDMPLSGEMRVTRTLFTLLSILLGCAVSVTVEYLLANTRGADPILTGIRQRLGLTARFLEAYASGETGLASLKTQISRYAARGTGELRERIAQCTHETMYKERLSAAVALSGRLMELAANLSEFAPHPSEADRLRCQMIAGNLNSIEASLSREEAPDWIDLPADSAASLPTLSEIERNVDLIAECFTSEEQLARYHLPEPARVQGLPIFADDAWTGRRHIKFAVRGTLSALACYIFYMSVGWTGLSASIATCILTALPNTGAARHKQFMRFAGMLLGACVLGFGSQAIILPQIDSIPAFTLLFASVIALGAWIGTSGPRIAYAGIQMVLAYDLVNLNSFTINTSLIPARDTVLGIILGIGAMWAVFDHLWAPSSTASMRSMFLSVLRDVANLDLAEDEASFPAQDKRLLAECERINGTFDQLRALTDFALFESQPRPEEEVYLTRSIRALQPQLRAFLLVKAGLLHHRLLGNAYESPELVARVQRLSSDILLNTAARIEDRSQQSTRAEIPVDTALISSMEMQKERSQAGNWDHAVMEMRLCSSLLHLAHDLQAGAS
jgi:multidrug resistance protein MdtO